MKSESFVKGLGLLLVGGGIALYLVFLLTHLARTDAADARLLKLGGAVLAIAVAGAIVGVLGWGAKRRDRR